MNVDILKRLGFDLVLVQSNDGKNSKLFAVKNSNELTDEQYIQLYHRAQQSTNDYSTILSTTSTITKPFLIPLTRLKKINGITLKCIKCNQLFMNLNTLKRHKIKSLTCNYQSEMITNDNNFIHYCTICQMLCTTKASLMVHENRRHLSVIENNNYNCWLCQTKCLNFYTLTLHIMHHHTGEKPEICSICRKQFVTKSSLRKHCTTHYEITAFACHLCGKRYRDSTYFKTHMFEHFGKKLYQCHECEKSFKDCSYYRKHLRIHSGYKPFQCNQCKKSFYRSDHLKKHNLIHLNQSVLCEICGRAIGNRKLLKQHRLTHCKNKQF